MFTEGAGCPSSAAQGNAEPAIAERLLRRLGRRGTDPIFANRLLVISGEIMVLKAFLLQAGSLTLCLSVVRDWTGEEPMHPVTDDLLNE